jgi:adenylosuccinate synthase
MSDLFTSNGVHILADGQFGSCGKGALASWLAWQAYEEGIPFNAVVTNAGPNSGHTFYHDGMPCVFKQLPVFAVQSYLLGRNIPVYFSGGSIIDPHALMQEHARVPGLKVYVNGRAGIVDEETRQSEHDTETIAASASTLSGTGTAIINKIARKSESIFGNSWAAESYPSYRQDDIDCTYNRVFVEVSQGFSLGIHSTFYPKVTSRECTFMQGMADARLAPRYFRRGYLAFRTYPIRVGNVPEGDSGGWYDDQKEVSWEYIGVEPEYTTVTKRKRRVATWSWQQFDEAMNANRPTHVFLNFMNYLPEGFQQVFFSQHLIRMEERGERYSFIVGKGPAAKDIHHHYTTSRL